MAKRKVACCYELLMCLQHSSVTSLRYQFLETNILQNSLKTKYFLFAQLMKGDSREGGNKLSICLYL